MSTDTKTALGGESSTATGVLSQNIGRFYVFEGIDGSGKTTVSRIVFERLMKAVQNEVILTAEPTSSWLGDAVRRGFEEGVNPLTEALLFLADRSEHTGRIKNWISGGAVVLCDRYHLSTLAYQGSMLKMSMGDRGLDLLKNISHHIIIQPDITFLFSIEPEEALKRIGGRDVKTKFERLNFLIEVSKIYHELARGDPRTVIIDATRPIDAVAAEVLNIIMADL